MNIKLMTFASTFALTLAASASAQMVLIPRASRGNVTFVKPTLTNLHLGLMTAQLTPDAVLTLSPVIGIALPTLPITPMMPTRDIMPSPRAIPMRPVRKVLPILPGRNLGRGVHLSESAAAPSPAKLDKVFDGSDKTAEETSGDQEPVREGRRINLPDDLAQEIGA